MSLYSLIIYYTLVRRKGGLDAKPYDRTVDRFDRVKGTNLRIERLRYFRFESLAKRDIKIELDGIAIK